MTKTIFTKLGLKKSQDIESVYKEPMSKEGPVFPIFRRRNIKKKPIIIRKSTLRKIKTPAIIIDTIDSVKDTLIP